MPELPDIAVVGISFGVAVGAYFLVWISMPGGIRILRDFAGYVALLYPKKNNDDSDQGFIS